MSIKEIARTEILIQLERRSLTQTQAADILAITPRQVRRLLRKYQKYGPTALVSKKRGTPGNHRLPTGAKELVLALIEEKYSDFGPTLAHEKIQEVHKIKISLWSIRKIMINCGLWTDKKIKKKRIYQLRERRSREGELIQIDGSPMTGLNLGPNPRFLCRIRILSQIAYSKSSMTICERNGPAQKSSNLASKASFAIPSIKQTSL